MPGKIFISYRRDDDPGFAQALYQRLESAFTRERLFMDVEGYIKAGDDFVEALATQVSECDVLLAIVGPDWLQMLDRQEYLVPDATKDFVRIEIEAALRRQKRVIPVLVSNASMPRADELPDALKLFARRNAVRLTLERFRADTQGLIEELNVALENAEAERRAAAELASRAKEEERARQEAEVRRRAEEQARAEEEARREKERARMEAIAGLSPQDIAKAEELANWEFIKESRNPQDFRDHLARFPKGVAERMARANLEALAWSGLGPAPLIGAEAVKSFLEEFPDGANAAAAKALLVKLEQEAETNRQQQEAQRRETEAWAAASGGDVAAVEAFVAEWPEGLHAQAARDLIRELKGSHWKRRDILTFAAGVAVAAIGAWALYSAFSPGELLWRLMHDQSRKTFARPWAESWLGSPRITSVAFPDRKRAFSASDDGIIIQWDVDSGEERRRHRIADDHGRKVAFSPDGTKAVSGSYDNTLKLWDLASKQEPRVFTGDSGPVLALAFSPDGKRVLSGSASVGGRLLDTTGIASSSEPVVPDIMPSRGEASTLKLWDVDKARLLPNSGYVSGSVAAVAFSPDGTMALSVSTELKLWDVNTWRQRDFGAQQYNVTSVAFSRDGKVLSGRIDGNISLWDVKTGKLLRTFTTTRSSRPVRAVTFSPDGTMALSAAGETLSLWNVSTGKELRAFIGHSEEITSIALSPDGEWALSGSNDGTLKVWYINYRKGIRIIDIVPGRPSPQK